MGKVYGLFGYPVGHSMSPIMHEAAFKELGQKANYHAFNVKPDKIEEAVMAIRALELGGCNVTIPHKVNVMNYLDEIDPEAAEIGAVNTIVNQGGKLKGFNTDGRGYLQSLLEIAHTLEGKSVAIIGAGGAARAIVTVLVHESVSRLVVANRTKIKAEQLIERHKSKATELGVMDMRELEYELASFDIIINTTSVGMSPNTDECPLSLNNLKKETIVSDLIYNPLKTKLLIEAESRGAKVLNGVGMFVNQGALSFEYWTGLKPDRKVMTKIVLEQLGGTHVNR
ncbi:shikimate 5-dehydrogenase [Alkalihalobacillus alcalophilus ATCC 27647 = CGMCC 1.3604]|uniref:Shikimate dehydrogenase (NADP(+)) n=1 Tax=Alkalihalobacillus alcalophilus ATCC 27647 = CGMCC 1.3604 TaxID=1218173 RepID=A0A094WQZ9_ALKAL|nr:shikimate dehydrogenase [Alkalihalobacillus alcalophilus]KGA98473.1 shikimate dehydrogenase [Alkalihalobacillus alcalophilus ATCC 27647 = CGMCC 1.3604]MED1563356.1 shikimate dehydrogenase [Alkalihalobacillus alcalophilus]THG88543.1 shikimate 5-dehydrogenase [Alkalihalobacillus alcalophilus ATCC 27647 = CGMCC 1.3604]